LGCGQKAYLNKGAKRRISKLRQTSEGNKRKTREREKMNIRQETIDEY
jgi:hypothetical protein